MIIALLIIIIMLLLEIVADLYVVKTHVKNIDREAPLATASKVHKVHIDKKA